MLNSDYRALCPVKLPFYRGRQHYMHAFDLAKPEMRPGFEDYLPAVITLCSQAKATLGTAYMTVDEKFVQAGMSQRKPGPHVDGVFIPNLMFWGHNPEPGWNHYCNDVGVGKKRRMSVIVAASKAGCRVWRGKFDVEPNEHGAVAHVHMNLDPGEIVPANFGYLLSPDCVHESMIMPIAVRRTFLRIALPTDYNF